MSTATPSSVAPQRAGPFHLVVGTFNDPSLHVLNFAPPSSLTCDAVLPAIGNHSWLALDQPRNRVYATSWTENDNDPAVVAYQLTPPASPEDAWKLEVLGSQITASRSGYTALGPVLSSQEAPAVLYSVGGPSGEVFRLDPATGGFPAADPAAIKGVRGSASRWQELDFITGRVSTPGQPMPPYAPAEGSSDGPGRQHTGTLAFGGLRNGSHSVDVGPAGPANGFQHLRPVYVADIGRNCTWVYTTPIEGPTAGSLTFAQRAMAPLAGAGPRHVWPHPNGKVVYVLEEHACTVDVYAVNWDASALHEAKGGADAAKPESGPSGIVTLSHAQSVRIVPAKEDPKKYWADEVRLSPGSKPEFLFGSTRGLEAPTKGWLALFALDRETGMVLDPRSAATSDAEQALPVLQTPKSGEALSDDAVALDLYQTPTSGGWANAIEPSPWYVTPSEDGTTPGDIYAVLTDSEQGLVIMVKVQGPSDSKSPLGSKLVEVARHSLGENAKGQVRGAATAVWLA